MIKPSCKTCCFWEPYNAVCFNGDSNERAAFTDRDHHCDCWKAHRCQRCGGLLEAREQAGRIWHYCYSCHFDFHYQVIKPSMP